MQGRGIVYILRLALIIPEKRVVYVVSIVAYQDVDLTKEEIGHEGLSAHAHNIVQEVVFVFFM